MYIQVCLCSSRWSSGVGNKVYSWLFVVVLNEVLPRQALKVHPWGSLVIDRVVRGLLVNSALGLREAEVLVRGLIRRFVVKSIRVERGNPTHTSVRQSKTYESWWTPFYTRIV